MKSKILTAVATVLVASSSMFGATAHAAGAAAFSLSPASGAHNINTTFSVGIYENGTNVNVVTANLSYDTAKLQLLGVDASGSAFAADAGSSSTSISRYAPAGATVSGVAQVATLNFKVIAGSGSAAVTVGTSGSHIASAGVDQWNGAATNGSYTLNTPVATPAPAAPSQGSNAGTTKTSTPAKTSGSGTSIAANNSNGIATQKTAVEGASTTATNEPAAKQAESNTPTNNESRKTVTSVSNHVARNTAGLIILALAVAAAAWYWLKLRKAVAVPAPVVYKSERAKNAAKTRTASKSKNS